MMEHDLFYIFQGGCFPKYLKDGNAISWIHKFAEFYCQNKMPGKFGMDVGCGDYPLEGAVPIEQRYDRDALNLPCLDDSLDYLFSSHCLEHLDDPLGALKHWHDKLRPGAILFLYLPHPEMTYWHPDCNKKHKHIWNIEEAEKLVTDAGFLLLATSARDLYWSFSIVAMKPDAEK